MQKYKRRIYLINPLFQLKVSAYICILVLISSLIYPFVIYDLVIGLAPKIDASKLSDLKANIITILTLWEIGFLLFVFIVCIFITHKIAGPMYKLKQHLTSIKEGDKRGNISFRDGDYFSDLADDVNGAFRKIKDSYSNDMVLLSEIDAYLKNLKHVVPEDKKIVINEICGKLNQIQERFDQDQDQH